MNRRRRRTGSLYASGVTRKYVSQAERVALAGALCALPKSTGLFVKAFLWTGARISEVLSLTPENCQVDEAVISIFTLKRREFIVREIPVPRQFMQELDRHFGLRRRRHNIDFCRTRLWKFHRVTGWRLVKSVMAAAGITGVRASPRGLRHSFGVMAIAKGVPLNIVQKLLGHSSIDSTAIYADAIGPEERAIVSRLWAK